MIRSDRTFEKLGHRKTFSFKIRDILKEFVRKGVLRLFRSRKSCRKRLTIISFRTLRRCVRKFNSKNVDADLSGTLSAHSPLSQISLFLAIETLAWSSVAAMCFGRPKMLWTKHDKARFHKTLLQHSNQTKPRGLREGESRVSTFTLFLLSLIRRCGSGILYVLSKDSIPSWVAWQMTIEIWHKGRKVLAPKHAGEGMSSISSFEAWRIIYINNKINKRMNGISGN